MGYAETPRMRAYSTDQKERLVRAVADGQPMRETAEELDRATDVFWSLLHGLVVFFMTGRLAAGSTRAEQVLDEMACL